ncbi:Carboxylic acid transporter protein-like [Pseudocercospora fuligena]|uniref:Carboxylic acid transporter protein-like n=1 Tax=Pseudocercospora fuligena TaxID=685502 RepID=A0A8H6RPU9_9PEZI|nr:Carboxylic acid transporter protein-like [Pseudocercospora fuligena]
MSSSQEQKVTMSDEKYGQHALEREDAYLPNTGETTEKMSARQYLWTRFSTLKPPMDKLDNPITLLRSLNRKQWLFFSCAFIAWTWDAFDFFTVSLTVSNLAEQFDKTKKDITWGITLVLMFRSVGAITFGLASDRYGRKWPFARGIISGMLQQGYAFGYLLATVFARALVDTTPHKWRPLYWFGGAVPVLIITFRLFLGETDAYNERKRVRESGDGVGKTFINEGKSFGRRFGIIFISIIGGALLYPYSFVGNERVIAAAFFEQFCVQGAWGIIPIHLMELSPGSLRAFVVGTSYQLGNLVSSASSTIEATIGERFPLPDKIEEDGTHVSRYAYGKVICIFMGCVYAYVIILTFLGPEYRGRSMLARTDEDLAEAAGQHAIENVKHEQHESVRHHSDSDIEKA